MIYLESVYIFRILYKPYLLLLLVSLSRLYLSLIHICNADIEYLEANLRVNVPCDIPIDVPDKGDFHFHRSPAVL